MFWQTIRRLHGKRFRAALFIEDSNGVTLKDQDAILNRWRDYFSDLLNPVDATPIQIHKKQVKEDIQITEADVNAVIKSLKTGKAPGEDDIRPEMLKAMNIYCVRWLTRVCKVACSTGQAPKQWQTSAIIPYLSTRKETKENAPIIGAYLSSVSQLRSMPNALKRNAVK